MEKPIVKKDCFALVGGKCSALTATDCEDCAFYKTREEVKRGRKRALLRILTLEEDIKDHIVDKYFDQVEV